MKLGMQVGLGPVHIVLGGDPALFPQRGRAPNFRPMRCGQMAGWIKMPLGMEVGLGPGDFVLDGDPAPLPKRGTEPSHIFGPWLLWPNGWMDQAGAWHGGEPWSRPHSARWRPRSPPQKEAEPPIFGPFLLWPNGWMHQDAT